MKILVINAGSSSLKYQFMEMENEVLLAKGLVERIGIEGSQIKHETIGKEKVVIEEHMDDHKAAIKYVVDCLTDAKTGAIAHMDDIDAVGHRVVHGGEAFSGSVVINNEVMEAIKECVDIAPLHNPPNITGIKACKEFFGDVPMVAVFDTSFHQTMPKASYVYPLPYDYYKKYKIRRYGFHGTSHRYVAERAAALLGKKLSEVNLITCHLGNGSSIAAIKDGKSVDTSMGMTPLEGLAMGTRCGDIDPAIVPFLMEKENLTAAEINNIMNKESGVLGVSGLSSDFRDLEDAADTDERAKLALDIFILRVKKYIGSYAAELGRVDAIVFTAGIGENSDVVREAVLEGMDIFGITIDKEANAQRGKELTVSGKDSKVKVFAIPTNEELVIARDTKELVKNMK